MQDLLQLGVVVALQGEQAAGLSDDLLRVTLARGCFSSRIASPPRKKPSTWFVTSRGGWSQETRSGIRQVRQQAVVLPGRCERSSGIEDAGGSWCGRRRGSLVEWATFFRWCGRVSTTGPSVMNTLAIRKLRAKLAADEAVFGLWVTLESPSITEMAVALGLDWVVIDAEHGHLDWKEIVEHVRSAVRSGTVIMVRITDLDRGLIKRALDIGADGVVVPWVETQSNSARPSTSRVPARRRAAASARNEPPAGASAWPSTRPRPTTTCSWCRLSRRSAPAETSRTPVPGRRRGDRLLRTGRFSSTAGYRGQWEGPGVAEQILAIKDTIRQAGKHCGVWRPATTTSRERIAAGLSRDRPGHGRRPAAAVAARVAGRRRPRPAIRSSFHVKEVHRPASALARPPESIRPDRPEVIRPSVPGKADEISKRCDVRVPGGCINVRGMTTGSSRSRATSVLAYHTHTFSESITLLRGRRRPRWRGGEYVPEPLDNVVIPRRPGAHRAEPVGGQPCSSTSPWPANRPAARSFRARFSLRSDARTGHRRPGAERVNRFHGRHAVRGGTGDSVHRLLQRGARTGHRDERRLRPVLPGGPAAGPLPRVRRVDLHHRGEATCVVEGRRYALHDRATALQPRGRVHYFINTSDAPMAMLWVYAGPTPLRIVVDERCATVAGNPWRRRPR